MTPKLRTTFFQKKLLSRQRCRLTTLRRMVMQYETYLSTLLIQSEPLGNDATSHFLLLLHGQPYQDSASSVSGSDIDNAVCTEESGYFVFSKVLGVWKARVIS